MQKKSHPSPSFLTIALEKLWAFQKSSFFSPIFFPSWLGEEFKNGDFGGFISVRPGTLEYSKLSEPGGERWARFGGFSGCSRKFECGLSGSKQPSGGE